MPIYEYECEYCSNRTEILQKLSDPPLKECPQCKGSVRKVVSPAGLHFKGSGWYVTDYAKKNGQGAPAPKGEKKQEANPVSDVSAKKEEPSKPKEKPKE